MSLWMNWLSLNHFGQNKYEHCYLATLKTGLYKSEYYELSAANPSQNQKRVKNKQ